VPGGIAGPPCPGGQKYGRLAVQVGGWATVKPPLTVEKLLGNTNVASKQSDRAELTEAMEKD